MNVERRNQLLSIVLGIIIIVLGYFLYQSIVGPYQDVIERQQMTERVRHQMETIRDVLVRYDRENDNFPPTEGGLDTLVQYLKTDSNMVALRDSLFVNQAGQPYNPDSLVYSVRPPHNKFEYTLNDTIRPPIYLLEDPDTEDRIGDLERTTLLNAASWE
jgi:type II secretory pathway pseudopilin PulG